MSADHLTGPERQAERAQAKRIRAQIYAVGGCGLCIHRDRSVQGWGRSICQIPGRIFPRCMHTQGKQFQLDHEQLKGKSNGE
ncbi:hypothetical protein ACN9MB_13180 [Dyella kyungheensis]|uniref:hypothetical protein n=1 Tax=Dyella kyungheensis TaxID=1242174 RepID=UPI003CEE5621